MNQICLKDNSLKNNDKSTFLARKTSTSGGIRRSTSTSIGCLLFCEVLFKSCIFFLIICWASPFFWSFSCRLRIRAFACDKSTFSCKISARSDSIRSEWFLKKNMLEFLHTVYCYICIYLSRFSASVIPFLKHWLRQPASVSAFLSPDSSERVLETKKLYILKGLICPFIWFEFRNRNIQCPKSNTIAHLCVAGKTDGVTPFFRWSLFFLRLICSSRKCNSHMSIWPEFSSNSWCIPMASIHFCRSSSLAGMLRKRTI